MTSHWFSKAIHSTRYRVPATESSNNPARFGKGVQRWKSIAFTFLPTYLVPATKKVYEDLFTVQYDGQTLSEILLEAGCIEPAAPFYVACLGDPKDTFGR